MSPPASRSAVALVLLPLVAMGCAAAAAPRAAREARFDGERAFNDLVHQVGLGPRVPGSPGHAATREWLVATLRPLAAEVSEDRFRAAGLELVNVIARFRPEARERVLLCAHWDTRPRADRDPDPARRGEPVPGANDGASGTAVLVELARLFKDRPPAIGVDLVFFDGEDYGTFDAAMRDVLLGSQRYAKTFRGPRPRFAILLDMVGDRDLVLRREGHSVACCSRTVEKVWAAAAALGHGKVFVAGPGPHVLDDHIPLQRAGIGAIDLIDLDYPAWHTTADLPDRCSAKSLQAVGETVAEVVYREPSPP